MNFGFLRETEAMAQKAGKDVKTGICRTGLETYLSFIFPNCKDWIHDRPLGIVINGKKCMKRPDYRSDSLRLIVEFDGLLHYQKPTNILTDKQNSILYQSAGYTVIRIPYFIQLTKINVERLFGVKCDIELFPENVCSLCVENENTPAFLCLEGIRRMAREFYQFPDKYEMEIMHLKDKDEKMTGAQALSYFYQNQNIQNANN